MGFQKLNRMNRKGMEFNRAFSAIVVVSILIIACGVIMGTWGQKYNSGVNYDLSEYQDLNGLSQSADSQKSRITSQDPDPGTGTDFESKLFRGGYGILGTIFLSFSTMFTMLHSIEIRFGIPSYVLQGIVTMIFFSIIASIIAVLFRLSREKV
jgi:hypothetical protein